MTMPALNISGWYDIFVPSTLNNYSEMKKRNKDTRLIMGPWTHMNFSGHFPEISFTQGSADAINLNKIKIDWFDRHVKGMDKPNGPSVKIYVMGINQWRDEEDWPLPNTKYCSYYLHKGGKLSADKGDSETCDCYAYNPMNPVPTVGGQVILPGENSAGPKDQHGLEKRDDVLAYVTDVLANPLEVTGRITLKLFASSDCLDTDFTAKLIDVFPDGRAMLLTDGILRARFRESYKEPKLLVPGEVYEFTIDVGGTANVFLPGHRIRLDISSSNFPKYNRNSNTGGNIATETADAYKTANNRVYHHSQLILPIQYKHF
jgi:putative CocE/NonD family hydrolase